MGIADLVKVAGIELAGAVDVVGLAGRRQKVLGVGAFDDVGLAEFRGKPAQGCQAVFDAATVDAALGPGG